MKSPAAIIVFYPDKSGVAKISNPSNYSLSRLMLHSQKIDAPIYFFNYSEQREKFNNIEFIPLNFLNIIKVLLHLGFNRRVLVISQTSKYDKLAIWLKRILNYKVMIRRGGVYYGKDVIASEQFKRWSKNWRYLRNADAFLSTADGTPVRLYAKAVGVADNKVYSWMNGFPELKNTKDLKRENKVVCISRLSAEKSIDYVIHSFAKAFPLLNKEYKLHIIGDGPEEDNLKELVNSLGLHDKIIFEGKSHDIEYWLFSSSVLVTGLANNTVAEGIAAGIPVVCVELGEMSELYRQFKSVYIVNYPAGGYGKINTSHFEPMVQQTAGFIAEVLNNELYKQVEPVDLSSYSWEARLNKEIELYSQLVANE